jgi:hypothetical protein
MSQTSPSSTGFLAPKGGGTFRDGNNVLRGSDGRFAYDGGPAHRKTGGTHGNTRTPDTDATLYGKFDADGGFQKWGIAENPGDRYSSRELNGGRVDEFRRGPRDQTLDRERKLVERFPGPENLEPWVVFEFPSEDAINAWFNSSAYQALVATREEAAHMNIAVLSPF